MRSEKLDTGLVVGPFLMRPVRPSDIDEVVGDLRKSDLLDIVALTPAPPHVALIRSLQYSLRTVAIEKDGRCLALAGRQPADPLGAGIWLIGTEGFGEALMLGGLRHTRKGFDHLRGTEARLYNYVPQLNVTDLKWLNWLGFKPVEAIRNFRGRGYTCIRMQWDQDGPAQSDAAP